MSDQSSQEARWIGGVKPPNEMLTQSMTSIYEKECQEQPECLARLLHAYGKDKSITAAMDELRRLALSPGPVLWIGMGASYCSSVTGSSFLQSYGRFSFAVDASEWVHYSRPVWDEAAVSILLTTSGESAELVQLCQQNARQPIALLCNNEKSTCWSSTQIRLPILAGPEYGNATQDIHQCYCGIDRACFPYAGARMAGRCRARNGGLLCRPRVNIQSAPRAGTILSRGGEH
jgi:glucosamine--fructose-6-phosphate aminotransferase (isomerizing)